MLGARVIGTSGSAEKLAELKTVGLDVAVRTRKADFAQAVIDATNRHGADLAINTVGGSTFAENMRALAFEGRLATVGFVDGVGHGDIDLGALHVKRLTVFGVSNKQRTTAQRAAAVPRFVAEVMPRFASGALRPRIDRVMQFAELDAAEGSHGIRCSHWKDRPAHAVRPTRLSSKKGGYSDETREPPSGPGIGRWADRRHDPARREQSAPRRHFRARARRETSRGNQLRQSHPRDQGSCER